jgi:hypothetical protein
MPTKTSGGPNEVVRLEVLRLTPPLRVAWGWGWGGPTSTSTLQTPPATATPDPRNQQPANRKSRRGRPPDARCMLDSRYAPAAANCKRTALHIAYCILYIVCCCCCCCCVSCVVRLCHAVIALAPARARVRSLAWRRHRDLAGQDQNQDGFALHNSLWSSSSTCYLCLRTLVLL